MTTNHFIERDENRTYNFDNIQISLNISANTFPPSEWAELLIKHMKINKKDKILDIGTGIGIIGIVAAKKGAIVSATDINIDAIKIAEINANQNSVSINFCHGEYFSNCENNYDLVIANLPQEIVFKDVKLGDVLYNSVNGGQNGNKTVIKLLKEIKGKKLSKAKLLMPISTLTDYCQTLNYATKYFDVQIHGLYKVRAKEYVYKFHDKYEKLNQLGKITIFKEEDIYFHLLYIVELKLKNNA